MDDQVGLVFSWDPRTRTWVKERGPEDGTPPPVPPVDQGAVQTFFLDPANGRWNGTILGLRARQISVELKDLYRAPHAAGLALPEPRRAAEPKRGTRTTAIAGVLVLLVLAAGGAFAAQAMLGPDAPPLALPTFGVPTAAAPSVAASAGASPSAEASATPTTEPTAAPAGGGGAPPPARTAPPPPPPQTTRLSVRLPTGAQVFFSGPAAIAQGTTATGIFSVVLPSGQGGNDSLTIYLGEPGSGASTVVQGARPDPNGNYVVALRATVPRGDQKLSVIYGQTPGIYTLGTIAIR